MKLITTNQYDNTITKTGEKIIKVDIFVIAKVSCHLDTNLKFPGKRKLQLKK